MRKLGCKYVRHTQSYYTDDRERPDVVDSRREYVRKRRKLQLRQHCWYSLRKGSLTPEELAAFEEIRETVEEAFWADIYYHEVNGISYIEIHVDFSGNGSDAGHDELRRRLGTAGGSESVRFSAAIAVPCEYDHAPDVCKCKS